MTEPHITVLPECKEIFKRVDEKLDTLISIYSGINSKYEKHIEDSFGYRAMVKEHDKKFNENDIHGRWLVGLQISTLAIIAVQIFTFVYLWGSLTKQVEINTGRMTAMENLHPRISVPVGGKNE